MTGAGATAIDQNTVLVIACGAIAREIQQIKLLNQWEHLKIQCLPAELHNRPEKIPQAMIEQVERYKDRYANIFVGYADCGTGGLLDQVCELYGLERLPGDHCYGFFAGQERFAALADQELGSFYLTDFLVRHFDRLIVRGLKLDSHPELRDLYFGHYTRVVYLAQTESEILVQKAQECADKLGMPLAVTNTGYGELDSRLKNVMGQVATATLRRH